MPRLALRHVLILACAAPGAAMAADPTGLPSCNAFLQAYRQCAASPGIPEAARPGILQSIESMGSSFRDAAAGSERARRTIAAQCVQTHAAVRQSLVRSFNCDFPAPAEASAGANAGAGSPAAAAPDPEQQETVKANAWVKAQNDLVQWNHMERDLASYLSGNERMLKPGAKPSPDNWYEFSIGNFDTVIARLRDAAALPGTVPGVDKAGAALLAALEDVNPVIKRLSRYQTTREFKEDNYKLAREQHPILVSGMKAAIQAADTFSSALFDRGMERDERRVGTLPKGSLEQRLLATSLSARRAVRQHDRLRPRADTAPMLAALAELSDNNKALLATLDAAAPKPDSSCTSYASYVDSMIGSGRDLARDIRGGSNPSSTSESFIRAFNRSVDYLTRCERRLAGQ